MGVYECDLCGYLYDENVEGKPFGELEADWDELRELGERYRELEKRCKEKAETWNKLKAMPPPQVD